MKNVNKKTVTTLAGAALLAITFTACGSSTSEPVPNVTTPTNEQSNKVTSPTIINPNGIETLTITVGEKIVLEVADPKTTNVEANPAGVVEVEQGGVEGEALMNPGFEGVAVGETAITTTTTEEVYTMKVVVVE